MKVYCNKNHPPLGASLAANYIASSKSVPLEIIWSEETAVDNCGKKILCETDNDLLRTLARLFAEKELNGETPLEKTEVDHWLTLTLGPLSPKNDFADGLSIVNKALGAVTYLACKRLTIADFAVFAALYRSKQWELCVSSSEAPVNVMRWYNFLKSQNFVAKVLESLPDEAKNNLSISVKNTSSRQSLVATEKSNVGNRAQEGKFIELPGAEMGKVVVRFPPEASGYLHIGHAKAALLNQYYQEAFQGKLIMRFDDTNPAKENAEFEKVILEDVAMLEIKPDMFTHTSQYFDLMLEFCEKLLKEGKAYVDDTDPETMKLQREQKVESANRNNTYEQNLLLWEEMKKGTPKGQQCCVRAKIDMQSPNGCMRDPTIYRCKNEIHPRTGDKYKVYPTYDFACPIVDSIEGVTHVLRTMEYHDRDPQFFWFINALGLRKPHIWEYSRLSMTNTVLSKRKLTWFVNEKLVDGWDDPRMPTVRGVLRRGMTVQGLKEFIIAQGSSRSVVFMEWDKIWAFNKKVIDPIAPRYTALDFDSPVTVSVRGVKEERMTVQKHPKNAEVGTKPVWIGPKVLIDRADAESLKEGENATFINWGNLLIKKINRENGKITSIEAEPNLENKDYKKTPKLTWLADTDRAKFTPAWCVYFDHIISKPLLGKDEDFKQFIGHETRKETQIIGDPELKNLKEGDIIELQRRGFFRVDVPYKEPSLHTCKPQPVILFYIPDGRSTKESVSTVAASKQAAASNTADSKKDQTTQSKPSVSKKSPGAQKTAADLNADIIRQGDLVRNLKTEKSPKTQIDEAVKVLLGLKTEYKNLTGNDWKPGCVPAVPAIASEPVESKSSSISAKSAADINADIIKQGDLVRNLKAQKSPKSEIDEAVKVLLGLKTEYKNLTGSDWKPGCVPPVVKDIASQPVESSSSVTAKSAADVNAEIIKQGDSVRNLKAQKSPKSEIDEAVKVLLSLKNEYKNLTGSDWKPGCTPPVVNSVASQPVESSSSVTAKSAADINAEIIKQGDLVRSLKAEKSPKSQVEEAVKVLLTLKTEYKNLTGSDWKPGCVPPVASVDTSSVNMSLNITNGSADMSAKVRTQGDKVPEFKSDKEARTAIDAAEKSLLALKDAYKKQFGRDFISAPAGATPSSTEPSPTINTVPKEEKIDENSLLLLISQQGDTIRKLKSEKAAKEVIDGEVQKLLSLKSQFKEVTGKEWKVGMKPSADNVVQNNVPVNEQGDSKSKKSIKEKSSDKAGKPKPAKQSSAAPKEKKPVALDAAGEDSGPKKQTRLGLEAKKEENLPDWYSQIITKSDLIEYYNVSGCYILMPWSYRIWENIRNWFDKEIEKLGVENCYFPMFVSKSVLEKEKTHIADFAPEVAWVTKSGDTDLAEPIAIRPTSETVMYPYYAKRVKSHRDLPIKWNQWNNVVRWEFKHPQPFLRTREFLWQEGHSAYASKQDACEEVSTILDLYARIYTDLLAIPVVKGRKTEKEKFAGGDYTLTVEAFISASGRAIQGATSHHLGQNFSKMFEIVYEDPETQEKKYVYQNSWGITTRTIGVLVMVHSDNKGLVLPPKVSSLQSVIVPCGITVNLSEAAKANLQKSCEALEARLIRADVRIRGDYREWLSPGWKFNHWELKGVPIRIEVGPKDIEKKQIIAVRRDTGEKITIPRDAAVEKITTLLDTIQSDMLKKAEKELHDNIVTVKEWTQFAPNLDNKKIILSPYCGDMSCEDKIKADSQRDVAADPGAPSMGAKSLCIPLEQPAAILDSDRCVHPECDRKPLFYTLFGRSY